MNTEPQISQRRRCLSKPTPTPFLPEDLIGEIISWLRVKPLMKMKCVSKSFNILICDPKFIKMHLSRSSRHKFSYLVAYKDDSKKDDYNFLPFSIAALHDNGLPIRTSLPNPYYCLIDKDYRIVVGSCNGLVCLLGSSEHQTWFRFWNPATRTISDKLGFLCHEMYQLKFWRFTFGYDNTTNTYKVVALLPGHDLSIEKKSLTTDVRILSFGDNTWRNIQSFNNALPLELTSLQTSRMFSGVNFNRTVNWLAIAVGRYVIISLDLSRERYKKMRGPPVPSAVSHVTPHVCVLMNELCFCHDEQGTDVIIWRMTKFGDDKSWTRHLLFSHNDFKHIFSHDSVFFNIYVNGDIIVFIHDGEAILLNRRNGTALKSIVHKRICWFSMNNYVESLVSTC